MKRLFFSIVFVFAASTTALAEDKKPHDSKEGRAAVWARNCARCHLIRSPATYSDAQWEVALFHHAVRGWISLPQMRTILEFLSAAN
jgi:hypothetical protein